MTNWPCSRRGNSPASFLVPTVFPASKDYTARHINGIKFVFEDLR